MKRRARIQQLPFTSLVPKSICMHARTFRHTPRADTQGCPELRRPRHAQPPAAATHVDQTWVPSLPSSWNTEVPAAVHRTVRHDAPRKHSPGPYNKPKTTPHSSNRKTPITQLLVHSTSASGTLAGPQHASIAVNSNNPNRGVGVRSTALASKRQFCIQQGRTSTRPASAPAYQPPALIPRNRNVIPHTSPSRRPFTLAHIRCPASRERTCTCNHAHRPDGQHARTPSRSAHFGQTSHSSPPTTACMH